jgi:hypothetical protein
MKFRRLTCEMTTSDGIIIGGRAASRVVVNRMADHRAGASRSVL